MTRPKRLLEIDALRGVAAVGVCLFHFSLYLNDQAFFRFSIFRYSATGVDLFFMISGFVILLSLETTRTQAQFWFARFNRIMPAYWLSMLIAAITYGIAGTDLKYLLRWNSLIGNLLMVPPLFRAKEWVGVYWTLYAELCFYALISLVWYCGWKKHLERVLWIGLALVTITGIFYLGGAPLSRLFVPLRAVMPLITCFVFFGAGMCFYLVYRRGISLNHLLLLLACFALTGLVHFIGGHFYSYLSLPGHLLCTLCFYLLFGLIIAGRAGFLEQRLLLFLGGISYPLYLFHDAAGRYLLLYLGNKVDKDLAIVAGLLLSVALATTVMLGFERPVHRWLKRLHRRS